MALFQHSLHSLPFELIEEIIVITTLLGDTRAAATLSQTCRSFRALVYHPFHKHLWREMFLAVFDDPFLSRDVRNYGRAPRSNKRKFSSCSSEDVFPWEAEYKRRIWTESFILRRTRPSQDSSELPPSSDVEVQTVLQTLLRVISTAAPLPNDALACMESHPTHTTTRPHPICPPLFFIAHMYPTLFLGSRNITWLARMLAHGLPHVLMSRLTVFGENGEVDVQKRPVEWDGLLAKLAAQIGLTTLIGTTHSVVKQPLHPMAIYPLDSPFLVSNGDSNVEGFADVAGPPVEEGNGAVDDNADDAEDPAAQCDLRCQEVDPSSSGDDSDFQPESESTSESDDEGMNEIDGDEVFGSIATPATTSLDGVRRLARIRVYNMAYLRSSRAFGPFLPIDGRLSKPNCSTDAEEGQGPSLTAVPPVPPIPESSFFLSQLYYDAEADYDDDDNDSTDRDADEDEGVISSESSPVPGDQMRFDWAWIAAARQVIELNLRDLLMTRHRDVLRALISLESLRPCSVPGFPLTVPEWSAAEGENGRQYRDGEGWDWAGVEGQWRRCVCWLDYGDLLCNNSQPLARRFSHPALYEVMRIIPLTIRISHYTRAPAAWPGRPTIHVVGEWHTTTPPALTRVSGTVEMAASGDVRWTLTSSREDGDGEWASEGVQLGGRGSAMGVIGLWTGADHEPSDPLGPFWAWKVGPATTVGTSNT